MACIWAALLGPKWPSCSKSRASQVQSSPVESFPVGPVCEQFPQMGPTLSGRPPISFGHFSNNRFCIRRSFLGPNGLQTSCRGAATSPHGLLHSALHCTGSHVGALESPLLSSAKGRPHALSAAHERTIGPTRSQCCTPQINERNG